MWGERDQELGWQDVVTRARESAPDNPISDTYENKGWGCSILWLVLIVGCLAVAIVVSIGLLGGIVSTTLLARVLPLRGITLRRSTNLTTHAELPELTSGHWLTPQ